MYLVLGIAGVFILGLVSFHVYYFSTNSSAKSDLVEKQTIEVGETTFRDLNNNGQLDIYEDPGQSVDARVDDVLSQMTIEEKVGLMWHPPIGVGEKGELLGKPAPYSYFFGSTYDLMLNRKLRTFNLFKVPQTRMLATWYNNLQKLADLVPFNDPEEPIRKATGETGCGVLLIV